MSATAGLCTLPNAAGERAVIANPRQSTHGHAARLCGLCPLSHTRPILHASCLSAAYLIKICFRLDRAYNSHIFSTLLTSVSIFSTLLFTTRVGYVVQRTRLTFVGHNATHVIIFYHVLLWELTFIIIMFTLYYPSLIINWNTFINLLIIILI